MRTPDLGASTTPHVASYAAPDTDGLVSLPVDVLCDPARLHLLAETGLVDASAAARLPTLDRVARLAARATRTPVAQVNLVSDQAQIPAAAFVDPTRADGDGRPLEESGAEPGGRWRTPVGLDASYCQHVVRTGAPLVVEAATAHPLVRDNRATHEAGIRAYAAAPLRTPGGAVLGSVCVVDFAERAWSAADLAALDECAAIAGEEVAARLGAARVLREQGERLEQALAAERAARLQAEAARADAERQRAEAVRANQAKSDFLAVMSHELRTPLNAIAGYTELLALGIRGPLTEQQRDDLGRIRHSQQHLLGLINEILNFARLEGGAVRYALEPVRVRDAFAAAAALVAPQAELQSLAFTVDDCAADVVVRADAEKLRQVLVNLLGNAVKFTPSGGQVVLACTVDGNVVRLLVRDTGIGIAPEKLAGIFEPFVQVRADRTRPAEGIGLGLAISRDLARGMGGELTVESVPGAGSTFVLSLPRA